ncbi:MAG: autotransporter outer membrane beta-barrel domain-containing protein, partial [Sulfurimonadaceae bacterium]
LMVTGAYVLKNDYNDLDATTGTVTNTQDITGFHVDAQLNLTDKYGVKAAVLNHNDKKVDRDYNVYSAGLEYNMRQNVRFCLEYSYTSSDRPDSVGTSGTTVYSGSDILFMSMVAF